MSIIKGFKFNKSLGQNFILDEGFLESIVAGLGLTREHVVVEIGTGAGTLTRVLARRVKQVVTYEIDKRLQTVLHEQFKGIDNIDLRLEDGLKANLPRHFVPPLRSKGEYIVVANIPYYITTPLIMKFMADVDCTRICVLVQDDVARRIVAKPGGKDYGALSVGLQARADCKIIKKVPRSVFTPVPNVDSAFVDLKKLPFETKGWHPQGDGVFDRFLKSIFSARRKTILNALKIEKETARRILAEAGIDENLRPEQIPVDKFVELSTKLDEILH